ncbi:DEAD/DEAH box helicase [Neisseria sp.]|uniref:DEAD/DEAH box helicase n=1 Tax=Neisseria sp. TaxID=192066 RepID=UPI0026DC9937|nr:DEAD/DEAH box helicase [Neisseria sp.]MDO4907088.1 DEAD/DEAH box helicase [Neisseria sp.]
MIPPRDAVEAFIARNALPASVERARKYRAELVESGDGRAGFLCGGSHGAVYRQTVVFDDAAPVAASCSCPYNRGGICKHIVAALRVLADLGDKGLENVRRKPARKTPAGAAKKPAETAARPLRYALPEDGLLDFDAMKADIGRRQHFSVYGMESRIIGFEAGAWTFETHDWQGRSRQSLTRPSEYEAELSCNCKSKQAKHYCAHLLSVLKLAEENLGADCLLPDYSERRISEVLADYGMTLQDDYAAFFEFGFEGQGLQITLKEPGLVPLSFSLANRTIPQPARPGKAEGAKADVVLVLHFTGGIFAGFGLYYAKRKKNGAPAANLKAVDIYNAGDILFDGMLPDNAKDIWYAVQDLSAQYRRFVRQQDAGGLGKTVDAFNRLLDSFPDLPLFADKSEEGLHAANLNLNHLYEISVSDRPAQLRYRLKSKGALHLLEASVVLNGKAVKPERLRRTANPFFIYLSDTVTRYPDAKTAADIMRAVVRPDLAVLKRHAEIFRQNIVSPLAEHYEIESRSFAKAATPSETDISFEKQVYVREEGGMVRFLPAAQYSGQLIAIGSRALRLQTDGAGNFTKLPRNEAAEREFAAFFESLHPDFQNVSDGLYLLAPEQLAEDFWFIEFADALKRQGIELLGAKSLKSWHYNLNKPKLSMNTEEGADWFDLKIELHYGSQTAALKDIRQALVKKQDFVTLSDGSIGMLPESWLAGIAPYLQAGEVRKDRIRLNGLQFGIIDRLYEHLEEKPRFLQEMYERKQRLQNLSAQPDVKLSDGLKATLRPYQQYGLNWLVFLHQNRLGGCLADDMGLGKTLQTIAFLHYLKTTQQPGLPSLIVAPATLVFNWQAEITKFCPGLKVLDYTGQGRLKGSAASAACDVVLTTYGTLVQDIDLLKEYDFYYVILDESQAIKNPLSQRYKACRLLKAYNRLILSGTPIENNTFDLYAQFNFLNPGLLGSSARFKKEFADAVDKNKDAGSAALLAKLVNPFILRRTKGQVAAELPPKTESVIYCEMGAKQRKVYETVKKEYREYLLDKIGTEGIGKSQIPILEGLTKLRQICNSPAMLEDSGYSGESAKLDILIENIKEKTGKHKILVFSSFVKMLSLIEGRLKDEGIAYEYLDGRTRKRQEKVENFQNSGHIRVFLISTKAGGTGLNLTEADYVFIVDPWWNPAVENQAVDRSHRIGQTKHVMAYRLICRDSIEEKILALQQKKQSIADSIVSVDEEKKSFDLDEVRQLFA